MQNLKLTLITSFEGSLVAVRTVTQHSHHHRVPPERFSSCKTESPYPLGLWEFELGMLAQACNPRVLEVMEGGL